MRINPLGVAYRRSEVIENLDNEVRMGNMDYFFNNILPPIRPEFDIEQIFKYCVKKKILTKGPKSKGYTWKAVPKNAKGLSNRVYVNPFMRIFRAVIKAAQETSSPKTTRTPFMPVDGRGIKLSVSDEKPRPFVYIENPNVIFPGTIKERHWFSAGFGFHFKGKKVDEFDVSISYPPLGIKFNFFYFTEYGETTSETYSYYEC